MSRAAYDARLAASARCAAALALAPFHAALIGLEGRSVFVGVTFIDGTPATYASEVDHEALNDRPERVIGDQVQAALRGWIGPPAV